MIWRVQMTNDEIKALIAQRVSEGISLSRIQDELTEKGTRMTYMELRMLASEIESADWSRLDKEQPKKDKVSVKSRIFCHLVLARARSPEPLAPQGKTGLGRLRQAGFCL